MPHQRRRPALILCAISLILLSISTGCVELKTAYIPPDTLPNGWIEAISLKNTGIEFLGLEKWSSITYEYRGNIKAFLTVITMNSLVLTDETELLEFVNITLHSIFDTKVSLNEIRRGNRTLLSSHTSKFIIYNGNNLSTNQSVQIIGEVWNCGISGISILCQGIIFSEKAIVFSLEDSTVWATIVGDSSGTINNHINEKGLIFNVKCH